MTPQTAFKITACNLGPYHVIIIEITTLVVVYAYIYLTFKHAVLAPRTPGKFTHLIYFLNLPLVLYVNTIGTKGNTPFSSSF